MKALGGRAYLATAAAVTAAAVGVGIWVGSAVGGTGSPAAASPSGGIGALPSYLPKDTLATDARITGTVNRPGLTSQGDTIKAVLPGGNRSVLVTVSGPETPGEGLPFQASADTATWTITLSHATAPIPLRVSAFSAIDELGKVYRPYLVPGQPKPPAVVAPGRTVRFELRAVMRVGEGDMRWAPVDNDLLGTWDFVVEND